MPFYKMLLLSMLGGTFVSLGFFGYVSVTAAFPAHLENVGRLIGSCVFPFGMIMVFLAGGETLIGNMVLTLESLFSRKITVLQLLRNWGLSALGNFIGAIGTAWLLGTLTGLIQGDVLDIVISTAAFKVSANFGEAIISGIGCGILVGTGVWLCYGADSALSRIFALWFPGMLFVVIGFQNVVANMFIFPAALFSGCATISIGETLLNLLAVFLGNSLGGIILAAAFKIIKVQ